MTRYSAESLIKNTAYEIGFSDVGITDVTPTTESNAAFDKWLEDGKHGEMRYLSGGRDKRRDPGILLEGAKSVVCVGVNYYSRAREQANRDAAERGGGIFSVYAHGRDYHNVLRAMLEELERRLAGFFPRMRSAICVDTQPVSERDLAVKSGLAWLGKNTCVISKTFGSWIFLGELITTLALEPDASLGSLCGSCTRCIEACPTGALDEPYVLDSRKCISYLTIEKRGAIPEALHVAIGNHLFGCDICQDVCPFNRAARESMVFTAGDRNPLLDMPLESLIGIGNEEFLHLTRGSAIRRAKAEGLRRNAGIVKKNIVGPK